MKLAGWLVGSSTIREYTESTFAIGDAITPAHQGPFGVLHIPFSSKSKEDSLRRNGIYAATVSGSLKMQGRSSNEKGWRLFFSLVYSLHFSRVGWDLQGSTNDWTLAPLVCFHWPRMTGSKKGKIVPPQNMNPI